MAIMTIIIMGMKHDGQKDTLILKIETYTILFLNATTNNNPKESGRGMGKNKEHPSLCFLAAMPTSQDFFEVEIAIMTHMPTLK